MKKYCPGCLQEKDISDFYINRASKDGKQSVCKFCSRKQSIAHKRKTRTPRKLLTPEERSSRKKASDKNWRTNNPGKVNARRRNYETQKLRAMPAWLSQTQLDEIKFIYEGAAPGFHVDHIIPLKGKNVCGLHVPWNLQYLSAKENLKKGRKF